MVKKKKKDPTKGFTYNYKGPLSEKEVDEALKRIYLKPRKKLN